MHLLALPYSRKNIVLQQVSLIRDIKVSSICLWFNKSIDLFQYLTFHFRTLLLSFTPLILSSVSPFVHFYILHLVFSDSKPKSLSLTGSLTFFSIFLFFGHPSMTCLLNLVIFLFIHLPFKFQNSMMCQIQQPIQIQIIKFR